MILKTAFRGQKRGRHTSSWKEAQKDKVWLGAGRSVSLPLTPPGCWMYYTWIFGAGEVGQEVGGSRGRGRRRAQRGLGLCEMPSSPGQCSDPSCPLDSAFSPAQEQLSSTYPTLSSPPVEGTSAGSVQFPEHFLSSYRVPVTELWEGRGG